jgi:hypothetical protein
VARDRRRTGLWQRLRRWFGEDPLPPASAGMFTARSAPPVVTVPPPPRPPAERLFDEGTGPAEPSEAAERSEAAEGSETTERSEAAERSETADRSEATEPIGAAAPAPTEAIPTQDGTRVRVHDERLDTRPGPIRMSPSEAVALATDGPAALRRRIGHGSP